MKRLSDSEGTWLISPIEEEEIKKAVWSCKGSQAPGPDGFNMNFIKEAWDFIKDDIVKFIQSFAESGILPKGFNVAFISLIPKVENAKCLKDFRPISLVGCLYKILAKVLARRLNEVIGSVVSERQSAFIQGRQILDGVLVASEVVESCQREKLEAAIFKLDFHKAHDSVSWNFLDWTLEKMNFPALWRYWMRECVQSASLSILVNGFPTKPFRMLRRLRQGDPLSPFLFNIAAGGPE